MAAAAVVATPLGDGFEDVSEHFVDSLQEELDGFMERIKTKVPAEVLEVFQKKIQQHAQDNILEKAVKTGDTVQLDFDLVDALGKHVRSKDLLEKGPIVLTFVRGSWCAFCNMQVHALQNVLSDMESKNATLVVVSPQSSQTAMKMVEQQGVTFPLLTDVDSTIAKQFNVHYEVDPELNEAFLKVGLDLKEKNQDGLLELPVPATYVIDSQGKVLYSFLDVNYRHRAEPADILNAIPEPKTRTRRRVYRKRIKQLTMLKLDWGDGAAT